MFDGWFSFAGTEVINSARFRTYVQEQLPSLTIDHSCGDACGCDHLADFLGEKPYASPLMDEAPWVDFDRPESFNFLGVQSLGVVGVMDDPRVATIVDALGDGGWITGRRRTIREMRFSVLLAAHDEDSMHYGETWLRQALDGECEEGCTPDAQLCFLTDCVDPADFKGVARSITHALSEWRLTDGYWTGSDIVLNSSSSTATLDLGVICDSAEWEFQIRGEMGSRYRVITDTQTDTFMLTGETDTIRATSTDGKITIQPLDINGLARWSEPQVGNVTNNITFAEHEDTASLVEGTQQSQWVQQVTIPLRLTIVSAISKARYALSPDECAEDYYRFIRRVACIDGPTVRQSYVTSTGAILRTVDFTLASEVPFIFGPEKVAAKGPSTNLIQGLSPYRVVRLSKNIPECTVPKVTLLRDPQRSLTPPPPGPSQRTDDEAFRAEYLKAEERRPNGIIIPAETIPQWANVVPTIRLTASEEARFVRVRFMPMPLESLAPSDLDPCSACGSFEVAYIPSGATFVIDGQNQQAYVTQSGRKSVANHLMTGANGSGTPSWPILSCGVAYLCVLDTRDQALQDVEIALAVRE